MRVVGGGRHVEANALIPADRSYNLRYSDDPTVAWRAAFSGISGVILDWCVPLSLVEKHTVPVPTRL